MKIDFLGSAVKFFGVFTFLLSSPCVFAMNATKVHAVFKKACGSKSTVTGRLIADAPTNDNISSQSFDLKPGYCKNSNWIRSTDFDFLVVSNSRPTSLEFRTGKFWLSQIGKSILIANESILDRESCINEKLTCISIEELKAGSKKVSFISDEGNIELELSSDGLLNQETKITVPHG